MVRAFSRVYVDPLTNRLCIICCCGRKSSSGWHAVTWRLRFPVELIPAWRLTGNLHLCIVSLESLERISKMKERIQLLSAFKVILSKEIAVNLNLRDRLFAIRSAPKLSFLEILV
jgi:hypothetical protein